jgi:hypothetical protein
MPNKAKKLGKLFFGYKKKNESKYHYIVSDNKMTTKNQDEDISLS